MKKTVSTSAAPRAIGPYSQAVSAGGLLFLSGQIAMDPATGNLTGSSAEEQTRQVLENLRAILRAAGTDMTAVLKTTVFLKDMHDFDAMNRIYAEYFTEPYPARAAVQVACLPKNALVEIEAVASLP